MEGRPCPAGKRPVSSVDGAARHDPVAALPRDSGDEIEVAVIVEDRQPDLLGSGRDQQIRDLATR